jgi:hypothetical protein
VYGTASVWWLIWKWVARFCCYIIHSNLSTNGEKDCAFFLFVRREMLHKFGIYPNFWKLWTNWDRSVAHFFDFNKLITNFVVHFSSRQLNELLKFENWKDFSFSCPMRHLCTKSKAYIYIYIIFDNEILIMDNKFENQKIIDCLRIMFRIQQSSTGQWAISPDIPVSVEAFHIRMMVGDETAQPPSTKRSIATMRTNR